MAVAAEVLTFNQSQADVYDVADAGTQPDAVRVQDLPEEVLVQAEFICGLGALAVGRVVEQRQRNGGIRALRGTIERAANGETASLKNNIELALTEALTSEGVMPDIDIARDADGRLQQDGQSLYDVLANSIQLHPGDHPGLHEIAYAEGLNYYALDELDRAGRFDNGRVWVIPCMVPSGVPARAIREYGYFENLAMVWRIVWKEAPGKFKLRTMFMAGVNPQTHEENPNDKMTPEELDIMYEQRLARRHDIAAVSAIYQDLGLLVPDDVPGFLRGFMMKRTSFNNPDHPEIDLARRVDNKLGPDYFLGRKSVRRDYLADGQRRAEAFKDLGSTIRSIISELVNCRHELTDDMAAARRLAQIAKKYAVDYAIDHPDLLPVIGSTMGIAAYSAIWEYHARLAAGDHSDAGKGRQQIHNKARANMCGFDDRWSAHEEAAETDEEPTANEIDSSEDCVFISEECPMCHIKKVLTKVTRISETKNRIKGSCGCVKIVDRTKKKVKRNYG